MRTIRHLLSFCVLLRLVAGALPARASDAAYSFTGGHGYYNAVNITVGFEFTTSAAIFVTDLGYRDRGGDGLANAHDIGIWDLSGSLLITGIVPDGTAGLLEGAFRYVSIAPTQLAAGTYHIGALAYANDNTDTFVGNATITMAPGLTFGGSRLIEATTLTYPTDAYSAYDAGWLGPNFKFNAVPEPSFCQMSVLLALYGAALWRKRRVKL